MWASWFLFLVTCAYSFAWEEDYSGAQVLQVAKDDNIDILRDIIESEKLEVWSGNATRMDVFVPGDKITAVSGLLSQNSIKFKVMIGDVQAAIYKENLPTRKGTRNIDPGHGMNWDNYQTLDVIYEYMDFLEQNFPQIVSVHSIGVTAENRTIKFVRISSGRDNARAVFIDGGIHAREWISPASVTYVMRELVENRDNLPIDLLELDFFILPVLNPDGYEYSHTSDRMWRKNRSMGPNGCIGADINRNFNFQFGGKGTSNDPCSEIYRGRGPVSEAETRGLQNFLISIRRNLRAYITFHNYGQYILIPYGFDNRRFANGFNLMWNVGLLAADAISRDGGANYIVGNTADTLYPAAGGSDDWVKARLNVPLVYCIELRDIGTNGFIVPSTEIMDSARDAFEAVRVISSAALWI